MADLSQIQGLQEPEPMDWDNYEPGTRFHLPNPGTYVVQAPQTFEFSARDGVLVVGLEPLTIVSGDDPEAAGYEIRFTRVSAKKFVRNGQQVNASMLGNYLRAHGILSKPNTNQEYAEAVEQTAGRTFKIRGTWEGYDKAEKRNYKFTEFPLDANDPTGKTRVPRIEQGDKVIFANFRVTSFIEAGE